jgi:hypothetical protein
MKNWAFISKNRSIISAILSIIIVFYAFNFVPRNLNIVASRTLLVQIFDYGFNFLIFFISFYLIVSLATYIYWKISEKK